MVFECHDHYWKICWGWPWVNISDFLQVKSLISPISQTLIASQHHWFHKSLECDDINHESISPIIVYPLRQKFWMWFNMTNNDSKSWSFERQQQNKVSMCYFWDQVIYNSHHPFRYECCCLVGNIKSHDSSKIHTTTSDTQHVLTCWNLTWKVPNKKAKQMNLCKWFFECAALVSPWRDQKCTTKVKQQIFWSHPILHPTYD